MSTQPILLRRASAGAGKTFLLVKIYIRMLLEKYFAGHKPDPTGFRSVLAVTFTNKATAEMKERILKELFILARDPKESDYYGYFSSKPYCWTETQLRKASQDILYHLLHGYGFFSVSTIDSFFQLVLRSFSREIGLYSSYQVELDRNALVSECVDRILDSLDEGEEHKELLKWLTDKAVYRVSNGSKFSIDALLLSVATELMAVDYKEVVKKAKVDESALYDHDRLIELEKDCLDVKQKCKADILKAVELVKDRLSVLNVETSSKCLENNLGKIIKLMDLPIDVDLMTAIPSTTDYKLTPTAIEKFFPPLGVVPSSDGWFAAKNKGRLSEAELNGLMGLVDDLRKTYYTKFGLMRSADAIRSQLYGFGIVRRIREEFIAMMKEKNTLGLDDTNEILRDLISDTDTPFIYEKVGVRYENFLLDEFQDTSDVQWDNFYPLLKESVDSGQTDLVVGDPKQSIYRWRNSNANLMTEILPRYFKDYIDDTHELDTNWRSSQGIIQFNNAFFAYAAERMDAELSCGAATRETTLQNVYRDVAQKWNKKKRGYIRLDFCEERVTEEANTKVREVEMEKVLDSIKMANAQGYKNGDVTVVVRRGKDDGVNLASYLMEHGIKVATSDTLGIKSSSIVRLLISLLASRDDPNDKTRTYLAESYLDGGGKDNGECSLVEICEGLLREIKKKYPVEFNRQAPYIRCFMDVLNDYLTHGDSSLHSFINYIDKRDDQIYAPKSPDAVNIITIHKVKGLEAPYVIVPFVERIEWARVDDDGQKVWCVPELSGTPLEGKADGVYQVPLKGKVAKHTVFENTYREEKRLEYIDNLNVLYVAFTRPIEVLHIISERPKDDEKASFPALLRDYANENMTERADGGYELGSFLPYPPKKTDEENKGAEDKEKEEKKEKEKPEPRLLETKDGYPSYPQGERLSINADSSDFFKSETEKTSDAGRVKGTILHDILSHVVYPEDLEAAVRAAVLSGTLEAEKEQETLRFLKNRIDRGVARGWFPGQDSGWVIRNEATILAPKADWNTEGKNLRTDRVLDNGEEVIVIDYKTGRPHSKNEEEYRKQMASYAGAYLAMGRSRVTTHLWYLGKDEVETKVFD